ncbi:MAG TPA: hypothetical protein VMD97_02010 [Candidatus Aquilonibacter sp.]|nr:hypothetical protein [Candidatus Aquilonibacter sp.]
MPAPAVTKIRGYEGQLYYTIPPATETIWANITDIELDSKADDLDASDHSTVGWKDKLSGLKDFTGTFKAMLMQSGPDATNLFAAYSAGTTITIAFRPQDVTGGLQFSGNCVITGFKLGAPNSGVQTVDLTVSGRGALTQGTVTEAGS